ncbi:MAG: Bis(5-nucleosyl)-tetraphosphatase [Myxococcaceae bacterium]|nr:Bis(5-nucleosyl)-tetraphosphatase [Myxococcaceae bacterium]
MADTEVRHLFIGDVHGCLSELDALLKKLQPRAGDRLVFVGDLVAKGPDSAGVVARVRELGAQCVRGNHDEAVLRVRRAQQQGTELSRVKKTHLNVAAKLQEADWLWLEQLPLFLRFPELDCIVVHAGVVPGKPLERQHPDDLMTMRTIRPQGTASPRLEDGQRWAPLYQGPEHVIFGHDAISGLQTEAFATGIDTGCVYGRELTALVVPGNKLVSVPARRVYRELDR